MGVAIAAANVNTQMNMPWYDGIYHQKNEL
jgi:hypothetical protein